MGDRVKGETFLVWISEAPIGIIDETISIDQMVTDADDQLIAFVSDTQQSQETEPLLLTSEVIADSKNLELIIDGEVVISSGQNKQQMILNDAVFEDTQFVCLQTVGKLLRLNVIHG